MTAPRPTARRSATTPERPAARSAPPTPSRLVRTPDAERPTSRSRAEAYDTYETARDAWASAMRAASSGKASDLAALAIVQEAYEAAVVERDRWDDGRVNIPIETEAPSPVDAVVGQELAWRDIRAPHEKTGLLHRLVRRIRG